MYKSLFSRLTLSFFITIFLIASIILSTMGVVVVEEPKRLLSQRLLRYNVEKLGVPPTNKDLKKFTEQLQISLTVTGENGFLWNSRKELPKAKMLESLTSPDIQFEFLRLGNFKQVVLVRHESFNYYISDYEGKLSARAKFAISLGLILLILTLYLNYRFIHWLFQPIKQLKSDAIKISEGDIDHHIKTTRQDELGELTQSVNAMADKLRKNISSKRELLLAISHELRTPLARAKMHLSLMPENEYRYKLDKNLNELNALVEALLQSEAVGHSQKSLNITELNISLLIQDIIHGYDIDRIQYKPSKKACYLQADELRIKLLISNLINNALQYSDGAVEVELDCQNNNFHCTIKDQGEGIAKDEIPHLTEAFYRPDKSRQRKTGNHGLGLYLCEKIVDAHNGTLEISSELDKGTTVKFSLN